ncbi:MAG: hypothetical protein GF346_03695 [Candidatus Eisenbacteria bacterium]|nr:hypothetical protein [Candidatus Latescibacterota bacterium]MBD3301527.1 hypothetical protein [Candidatus Eisenbacteria bacterium]
MSRILTILRREYRERVRRRSFLLGTVLVPVFILGVTFLPVWIANRTGTEPVNLYVVDRTGSLAEEFEASFDDSLPGGAPRFRFDRATDPPGGPEEILDDGLRQSLLDEEYDVFLYIPENAFSGEAAQLYSRGLGDLELAGRFRSALGRAAMVERLVARGIPAGETDEISRPIPISAFKLTEEGVREGGAEIDWLIGVLFGLILYMTILLYGVSVQRSVIEEKSSRIVEILLVTVRPFQLMLGKIIGVGAVGLTQYAIWFLVASAGSVYLRQTNPAIASATALPAETLAYFVVYFILGYFLFAAIYAAVGAMVSSEQEAQQTQWPVTILLIIPMILMQLVLRSPSSTESVVLSLVPFFAPILMVIRINIVSPPLWQILASLGLLVLSILFFTAVAARIFRVGILMVGKRPTLPELLRWIRES